MTIPEGLEAIRIALSLFFLLASSYYDYKDRRVPDTIFKFFMPIAAALTLIGIMLAADPFSQLVTFILYLAVSVLVFYAVYYFGLFGGADAKMLIALSMAVPWPPRTVRPLLGMSFPVYSISILDNTLLSTVLTLPYALLSNILWKMEKKRSLFEGLEKAPLIRKIGALVFCVKKEKAEVKPYHTIAEEDGKILLFRKVQEEDLTPEEVEKLPQSVFVTFAVPMIIFITIGFLAAVFLGDLIVFLISLIMG